MPDFYFMTPEKSVNQTSGITPRHWVQQVNPGLTTSLHQQLKGRWPADLPLLSGLESLVDDTAIIGNIRAIESANKTALSQLVAQRYGIVLDPLAMSDCQIKRIHEYRRQLLNILHVIAPYLDIKETGRTITPKVHLFAGRAVPGYRTAKLIIQLINTVVRKINRGPRVAGQLKVAFLEDYKVSLAGRIIPTTDFSEQISTTGTEASDTSNMKFAMNGALIIGTYDGANIEIREAAGVDNFYLFDAVAEKIEESRRLGHHHDFYHQNPVMTCVVDTLVPGSSISDCELFASLHHVLIKGDHYCHLLDFDSHCQAQWQVMADFGLPEQRRRRTLLNICRMGEFSSDRTVRGYARDIWGITC